jgi:dephospho-CoA kinase
MRTEARQAWIAGVTGGIGSGKTVFARALAAAGGRIVDADRIAARLVDSDADVRNALAERFGKEIFDGSGAVDRGRLASLAFGDPGRLEALNRAVWPALVRDIGREIRRLRKEEPGVPVILDMAVLFETGCDSFCDAVITVRAPLEDRVLRIRELRGWDERHIRDRMTAQMDDASRAARSDFIVDNDGSAGDLEGKALNLRRELENRVRKTCG